jgi:thiosulfate/3-mercaptopyruvate sulfurtransferase
MHSQKGLEPMNATMTNSRRWALALALTFPTLTSAADPSTPKGPPLISQEALQKRLTDPNVRVIDARTKTDYEKDHISGAVWLDSQALGALAKPENFENKEAWGNVLAPLGIGKDTEVFVYDDARQHDAARAWWLLGYAGVNAGLVDGGFKLWQKEGRPIAREIAPIQARGFTFEFHPEWVATRADVADALKSGKAQLLDARSVAEYRGETPAVAQAKPGRRPGHIPTARSLEGNDLVDAEGRFLSPEAQRERLTKAGITKDRPVIAYAASGARSALVIFALSRLDIPARHYHVGLGDWLKDASAPIVTGDEPGRITTAGASAR